MVRSYGLPIIMRMQFGPIIMGAPLTVCLWSCQSYDIAYGLEGLRLTGLLWSGWRASTDLVPYGLIDDNAYGLVHGMTCYWKDVMRMTMYQEESAMGANDAMHAVDTTGMFHIVNGAVHSCDGDCGLNEHWTTLDHAMNAVNTGKYGAGAAVHRAPQEASYYRPVPIEMPAYTMADQLSYKWDATPLAEYEPSVVNRMYEIDRASMDIGDYVMNGLWLALSDHDPKRIIGAAQRVMDWSYGLIDGQVHPLAWVAFDRTTGQRNVLINGKLQRLASDMYCGGWTSLQQGVDDHWTIPSLIHDENGHKKGDEHTKEALAGAVAELSNPLAYLESTRMAILTMKDAMFYGAIDDMNMMVSNSIDPNAEESYEMVQNYDYNLGRPDPDPYVNMGFGMPSSTPSVIRVDTFCKACWMNPVDYLPNTTSDACAFGFTEAMSPLETMFAMYAMKGWVKEDMTDSYRAASWKLARSVWSGIDKPLQNWDDPLRCDESEPMDMNDRMLNLAMDWFLWVYRNQRFADWIAKIPVDQLDPWRKMPMTGKIDRLHTLIHKTLDADGIPHATVINDARYFNIQSRVGLLFRDMPSLSMPYTVSDVDDNPLGHWAITGCA